MGAYINLPDGETKEAFLERTGIQAASPETLISMIDRGSAKPAMLKTVYFSENTLPVCLVDNGNFTAAGIAYSEAELRAFAEPQDTRPKEWYLVDKDILLGVCPELEGYLHRAEKMGVECG